MGGVVTRGNLDAWGSLPGQSLFKARGPASFFPVPTPPTPLIASLFIIFPLPSLPLLPFSGLQVYQTLRRGGHVSGLDAAMRPIVPAGLTLGYRNKVSFTFSARCWEPLGGGDGAEDERGRVVDRCGVRGVGCWKPVRLTPSPDRIPKAIPPPPPPPPHGAHTHTHACLTDIITLILTLGSHLCRPCLGLLLRVSHDVVDPVTACLRQV